MEDHVRATSPESLSEEYSTSGDLTAYYSVSKNKSKQFDTEEVGT